MSLGLARDQFSHSGQGMVDYVGPGHSHVPPVPALTLPSPSCLRQGLNLPELVFPASHPARAWENAQP